jgi:hypothetical protein
MNKYRRGELLEPVLILIGLVLLVVFVILPQSKDSFRFNPSSSATSRNTTTSKNYSQSEISSGPASIMIDNGNAESETDAVNEYITLSNDGSNPINISGWKLANGKDKKTYLQNGRLVFGTSDVRIIPAGTLLLNANGNNIITPIILNPGERAVVTSGSVGPRSDVPLVSFKENKCSGYLEAAADYKFTPSLDHSCMNPKNEAGFDYLESDCQEFIESMGYCHTPKFNTKDTYGESCRNCVDGVSGLSSSCIAYIKSHYTYQGCLSNHSGDSDFQGKVWRVFLGSRWELWSDKKETISLFDQSDNLIDSNSY